MGFIVARSNGLLRIVDLKPEDIIAESTLSESRAHAVVTLSDASVRCPYTIIPFTVAPKKTAEFTLCAEVAPETDCVVSLEPLESRFDWIVHEVDGD